MMLAILTLFPSADPTVVTGVLVLTVLAFLFYTNVGQNLPLVNAKEPFEFRLTPAKKRYVADAKSLIARGLQKVCILQVRTLMVDNKLNASVYSGPFSTS